MDLNSKMQAVFILLSVMVLGASAGRIRVTIPLSDYVWDPYPLEMLPWVQKAFQDIASSEAKMALLYHAWNIMPQHGIKVDPFSQQSPSDEEAPMNLFETNDESEREVLSSSIFNLLKDAHQESLFQDRMGIAFDKDRRTPRAVRFPFNDPEVVDGIVIPGVRGTAGVDFPDYVDVPDSSFSCADKGYIPGFYADLETGCQAFHLCWPHKKDSFLCPIGTLYNQAIMSCDYWYSTNCSLAPLLYYLNARVPDSVFYRQETEEPPTTQGPPVGFVDWTLAPKFPPMAYKTEMYPEEAKNEVKQRRHVRDCSEDSASPDDCPEEDVEVTTAQPAEPRVLKKIRINSKFIVDPAVIVVRPRQREFSDLEEKMTTLAADDVQKDGEDGSEKTTTTNPPVTRRKLLAVLKDLVGESLEDLGESVGTTVAVD